MLHSQAWPLESFVCSPWSSPSMATWESGMEDVRVTGWGEPGPMNHCMDEKHQTVTETHFGVFRSEK